jgi:hypothetical protein
MNTSRLKPRDGDVDSLFSAYPAKSSTILRLAENVRPEFLESLRCCCPDYQLKGDDL